MSKLNINPDKFGVDRYRMPQIEVRSQKNNKTYFTNVEDVSKSLSRNSKEIVKFIGLTNGTRANVKKFCINGEYSQSQIQESVYDYIRTYVLCPVCNNPETKIFVSKSKKLKIGCQACGGTGELNNNPKFDKWLSIVLVAKEKK